MQVETDKQLLPHLCRLGALCQHGVLLRTVQDPQLLARVEMSRVVNARKLVGMLVGMLTRFPSVQCRTHSKTRSATTCLLLTGAPSASKANLCQWHLELVNIVCQVVLFTLTNTCSWPSCKAINGSHTVSSPSPSIVSHKSRMPDVIKADITKQVSGLGCMYALSGPAVEAACICMNSNYVNTVLQRVADVALSYALTSCSNPFIFRPT